METQDFPTIILASRNRKKSAEIADLFARFGVRLQSVADFEGVSEVVEDGESFAENAAKKATQTAMHLDQWALGEDSGLCVDALKGAPGIYSARYAGEDATDQDNNRKLIEALAEVPRSKRAAHYVCHVSLSSPDGVIQLTEESYCHGEIIDEARGTNGFGYDPHFFIREYHQTFGELGTIVKQHLSHRARAFHRFLPRLIRHFHDLKK